MLDEFIKELCSTSNRDWEVFHHEILPERPPRLQPIPGDLHGLVKECLSAAGLSALYSHQAEAVSLAMEGKNVAISTSTASGKTLAYQIPVLDTLLKDPTAHALFLFPLKALERDQYDSFLTLAQGTGVTAAVYDGDTPDSERRMIKQNPPRVIITNPDMLHVGFLAYHDSWRRFFGRLRYVILDEVHTYKGIFGSHISQVLLRIKRVCAKHGSRPRFIACSATVANPEHFVSVLTGEDVSVVSESGAPSQQRNFVFVNPILSLNTVAARLFISGLELGLKTIVFARARRITELITTWVLQMAPKLRGRISSYRAGFLPEERRRIEAKLFSGEMDGVITTSALEMGIDVGGLDLCLLVGYPGTVINTWQRGGRVGRAGRPSAIVLIAGTDALDQYFMRNPSDFFARSSEEAILDPRNKEVLKRHLPCAAAETPILPTEGWINEPEVEEVLQELEQTGALYRAGPQGAWHSANRRPQRDVDLRGIGRSFGIFLEDRNTLIGTSAGPRVYSECHKGAVYLHRTRQYEVTLLDLEKANVLVRPARLNYYTRAVAEKDTKILGAPLRTKEFPGFTVSEARLEVTERVTSYEKRRTNGQDLIGTVALDLPPVHFETVGIWISIPIKVRDAFKNSALHFMGGIHALEHAAISMFPLFALCDRDDIGGISTPMHEQVCKPAVFIYDGHPGGVGLSHRAFDVIEQLLIKTTQLVEQCPCDDGCPSCIHSPKCGSGNKPLDKRACLMVLRYLLHPETVPTTTSKEIPVRPTIFPDLPEEPQQGSESRPGGGFTLPLPLPSREGNVERNLPSTGADESGGDEPRPCIRASLSTYADDNKSDGPVPSDLGGYGDVARVFPSRAGRTESEPPAGRGGVTSALAHMTVAGDSGRKKTAASDPGHGARPKRAIPPTPRTASEGEEALRPIEKRSAERPGLTGAGDISPPVVSLTAEKGSEGNASSSPTVRLKAGPKVRVKRRSRKTTPAVAPRVVVFDLETQKLADEVGGWRHVPDMKMSIGVAHTEQDGFLTFTEAQVRDLIGLLRSADLVVGFNQMRFDYLVLSAYTKEDLRALPNLDMLVEVQQALGFRVKLDTLAQHTLNLEKSGDGLDAVRWFREGRMDLVEDYCRQDVRITRDLYLFGRDNGYLVYKGGGRTGSRVPVDWS
ncbi:MAG: DEAD/DEAH box helicase [Thermodesulfobacteriota bacterium]